MLAACARAPEPEPEPEAPPSPVAKKKKKKKKAKNAPDEIMTIVVRDRRKDSSEEDTTVKLRTSTKLARVFGAYADGLGVSVDTLRFLYKGGDVYGDETAGAIGLAEGALPRLRRGRSTEEAEEARHRHGGPLGRVPRAASSPRSKGPAAASPCVYPAFGAAHLSKSEIK